MFWRVTPQASYVSSPPPDENVCSGGDQHLPIYESLRCTYKAFLYSRKFSLRLLLPVTSTARLNSLHFKETEHIEWDIYRGQFVITFDSSDPYHVIFILRFAQLIVRYIEYLQSLTVWEHISQLVPSYVSYSIMTKIQL
jgi:hypothetical protein